MDAVRDLGRVEPWQESLERSRARRHKSRSRARSRQERRPERHPAQTASRRHVATDRARPRGRNTRRLRMLAVGVGGVFALGFPVAVLPSALGGRGTQASATAGPAPVGSASAHPASAESGAAGRVSQGGRPGAGETRPTGGCQPASTPSDYVNPLAGARVRPERIDQGVDYAGSGTLAAIGAATVTYAASSGTGWPGSFIE